MNNVHAAVSFSLTALTDIKPVTNLVRLGIGKFKYDIKRHMKERELGRFRER